MTTRLRRPGRGVPVTIAAAAWAIAAQAALAQPVALEEQRLANITAAPGGPRVVVAGDSAETALLSIELRDGAQRGAAGVNVVNASGSDVAIGVNVARTVARAAATAGQRNGIVQTAERTATLGELVDFAPGFERRASATSMSRSSASHERIARVTDRHVHAVTTTTRLNASVDAPPPSLFEGLTLEGQTFALDPFSLALEPFNAAIQLTGGLASLPERLLGISFNLSDTFEVAPAPISVSGAELFTGSIEFSGDDIVLRSPELRLDALSFTWCFRSDGCNNSNRATVDIPATTLELPDIMIANPVEANGIGFGYAVAGDGTIVVTDGSVRIDGAIPLDPAAIANQAVGVLIADTSIENLSLGVGLEPLSLPTFELPLDLTIPLEVPDGFNGSFDDESCTFASGERTCRPLDVTTTEHREDAEGRFVEERRRTRETAERRRTETYSQRGAVRLAGAAGELIVLRGASAESQRYSVLRIEDGAQAGMRALNAVNSAGAIVGNGVNIASPEGLSQSNTIRQIGGL